MRTDWQDFWALWSCKGYQFLLWTLLTSMLLAGCARLGFTSEPTPTPVPSYEELEERAREIASCDFDVRQFDGLGITEGELLTFDGNVSAVERVSDFTRVLLKVCSLMDKYGKREVHVIVDFPANGYNFSDDNRGDRIEVVGIYTESKPMRVGRYADGIRWVPIFEGLRFKEADR